MIAPYLPKWLKRLGSVSHGKMAEETMQRLSESLRGDSTYHSFTNDFDQLVQAANIETLIGPLEDEVLAETEAAWSLFEQSIASMRHRTLPLQALLLESARGKADILTQTTVTLLIDLSGSMRGNGIQLAAGVVETSVALFEELGVSFEILGFTTTSWKGGQSRRRWSKLGRPAHPGRLCDLLHIIYRDAEFQGPFDIKPLFRTDILHENVDGEAIEWAYLGSGSVRMTIRY